MVQKDHPTLYLTPRDVHLPYKHEPGSHIAARVQHVRDLPIGSYVIYRGGGWTMFNQRFKIVKHKKNSVIVTRNDNRYFFKYYRLTSESFETLIDVVAKLTNTEREVDELPF